MPITNSNIIKKIHQTYRIKYLKDSVLMGVLDDPTLATLENMIAYNNVEILMGLQEDDDLVVDL